MESLILNDVGDGLNLHIFHKNDYQLIVDFGGDKNLCRHCFCCEDDFLLSHFHEDHYNGFYNCNNRCCHIWLNNVYYPIMPSFTESKDFYLSLLSMNIRISNNYPIQGTFFHIIKSISRNNNITFSPLSKGDTITCGNKNYTILWPPSILEDTYILSVIRSAITDFNDAKRSDPSLRVIYESINRQSENANLNEICNMDFDFQNIEWSDSIDEKVKKANDSLRKAANRLSIAFRQDDNILFLGDLEKREINTIVNDLTDRDETEYEILISAHHGTHWHKSLYSIRSKICLASVGSLMKYIKNQYKDISEKFIRTDELGDIVITKKYEIS